MNSLNLPIAPDIVIAPRELIATATGVHVSIEYRSESDNEIVLGFLGGIGLSFFMVGIDRMYVDVPLLGKAYYQRVGPIESVAISAPPKATSKSVAAGSLGNGEAPAGPTSTRSIAGNQVVVAPTDSYRPSTEELQRRAEQYLTDGQLDQAQALLLQAKAHGGKQPEIDYRLAILRSRQSDGNAALRHLGDAVAAGFRSFDVIEADPDLQSLKSDVRYAVLKARYR